jgi:hypothetical protein
LSAKKKVSTVDNTTGTPMTMDQAVNSMFAPSEEVTQDEVQEETIETEVAQDAGSEDQAEAAESDDEAEEDADDSEYEADEADAADENSKDRIPVKINGKTELWTLDELKRSAAGQGYIQQGMREVAEIKKEAGSVYQALQQERQQLSQIYNQLTSGQVPLQAPNPPAKELLERDPIGYMEARIKYDEDVAAYQQTQTQMQKLQAQQAQLNQQAQAVIVQEQMKLLQQAIPEFSDPKTGTALRDQIIKTAVDVYGFDQSELMSTSDHRHIRVLKDAMEYRKLMQNRAGAEQKASKARPVVKPGAQKRPESAVQSRKKQIQRAKQTGKIDDFMAAMFK